MPLDQEDTAPATETTEAQSETTDTPTTEAGTSTATEAQAETQESFVDPSQLPPELKPHWKRMHGAYTKSREELKQGREAVAQIKRFYSDPEFARQTINQVAGPLGYQLTKPGETPAASAGSKAPAELVEKIKAGLSPELQWMAKDLANSQWEAIQAAVKPLQEKQDSDLRHRREQELDTAEREMDEKYPGWDEHKDAITDIVQWIQEGPLTHPRYGNKYEAAYKFWQLQSGNNGALMAETARRMGDVARSRTTSGTVQRQAAPNHDERIRKAKTREEAWAIAAEVGRAEAKRLGANIE